MRTADDHKLLRQSKQGDRAAFETLYARYLDCLLSIAMNLLGDAAAAEDVVQEVFVKFTESLPHFTLRGSLKGYLATCAANRARDVLRQRQRRQDRTLDAAEGVPDGGRGPIDLAESSEQLLLLRKGLGALPYEQREVITLRHHGGLKFKEIAALQETAIQTVQSRYAYGMEKLRVLLNGEVAQ